MISLTMIKKIVITQLLQEINMLLNPISHCHLRYITGLQNMIFVTLTSPALTVMMWGVKFEPTEQGTHSPKK